MELEDLSARAGRNDADTTELDTIAGQPSDSLPYPTAWEVRGAEVEDVDVHLINDTTSERTQVRRRRRDNNETRPGDDSETILSRLRTEHPRWFNNGKVSFKTPSTLVTVPLNGFACYFRRVRGIFGGKFVLLLFLVYFSVKGVIYALLERGLLPYLQGVLGVSGVKYQDLGTVALIPWALKPIFGMNSDVMPILGYHKRYYIAISLCLSLIAYILIAAVAFDENQANLVAVLFLFGHLGVAVSDILCEGMYAQLMVIHPYTGSDLTSWVWASYMLGRMAASGIVGPMADANLTREMFWICVPMAVAAILPILRGFLPEKRAKAHEPCIHVRKIYTHLRIFIYGGVLAMLAVGLAAVSLFGTPLAKLIYAIFCSLLLSVLGFYLLPRMLAKANMYLFLVEVLYIQINGALEYFYTAEPNCVEGGPNFSYVFFSTKSALVQAVFGALGVVMFQAVFSKWRFRQVFWVTTLLRMFASLSDVIMAERWNKQIGISDEVMFMMGDNIIYQVAYMIDWMPIVILTSKMCPRNMEATLYALLAGFQNFGQVVARSIGSYMIDAFDVQTEVPCNFKNLSLLVVVAHVILPALAIPLTFLLIPDAKLTDTMVDPSLKVANESVDEPMNEFDEDGHERQTLLDHPEDDDSSDATEDVETDAVGPAYD